MKKGLARPSGVFSLSTEVRGSLNGLNGDVTEARTAVFLDGDNVAHQKALAETGELDTVQESRPGSGRGSL